MDIGGTFAASISSIGKLTGSGIKASTITGDITFQYPTAGTIEATSGANGISADITFDGAFSGTIKSAGPISGAISLASKSSGTIQAASNISADITSGGAFSGTVVSGGSISGSISLGSSSSGTIQAAGDITVAVAATGFTGNIQCPSISWISLPAGIANNVHPKYDCSEGFVTWTVNGLAKECPPTIVYVDAGATAGANNGQTWSDAYTSLQSALSAAAPNTEIWVAQGTYKPTFTPDRNAAFTMKTGVAIYGGFPEDGGDGTFGARNPTLYPTFLSGDIGTPGVAADNCYHVVTASGTDRTAVLDGVTVRDGNAQGGDGPYGPHGRSPRQSKPGSGDS